MLLFEGLCLGLGMTRAVEESVAVGGKPRTTKDEVFREVETVTDFNFGEKVASVFDDMLDRSVPFYQEIQRMIAEMATDFAVEGTNIYDLGCSTGNTLLNLDGAVGKDVKLIGVDYSEEMLARCREKLTRHGLQHEHELVCADLNQGASILNAS